MKFGIVTRPEEFSSRLQLDRTNQIISDLESAFSVKVFSDGPSGRYDVLVCVGGDGTLLHNVFSCERPVFGILDTVASDRQYSVGHYHAGSFPDHIRALERIERGDYFVQEVDSLLLRFGKRKVRCLNEFLFLTSSFPYGILPMALQVDSGSEISGKASGMIVSTPTGFSGLIGPIFSPFSGTPVYRAMLTLVDKGRCIAVPFAARSERASFPRVHFFRNEVVLRIEDSFVVHVDGRRAEGYTIAGGGECRLVKGDPVRLITFERTFVPSRGAR